LFKGFTCPSVAELQAVFQQGNGNHKLKHDDVEFDIKVTRALPNDIKFFGVEYGNNMIDKYPSLTCRYFGAGTGKYQITAILDLVKFQEKNCTIKGGTHVAPMKEGNTNDLYKAENPGDIKITCK